MISWSNRCFTILHLCLYLYVLYILGAGELSGSDKGDRMFSSSHGEHVRPLLSVPAPAPAKVETAESTRSSDLQNIDSPNFGQNEAEKTLLLTQVIFRHGDRSPLHTYPNDPHKNRWPQGLGQLTQVGMVQAYQLGLYLRQRYQHLLSEGYKREEVYMRSTDYDRTLMTAECVAAGLFPLSINKDNFMSQWPLGTWQPVPIHSVAEKSDMLLHAVHACKYVRDLRDGLEASYTMKHKIINDKEVMLKLSQHTGMELNVSSLHWLADIIFCQKSHNMSQPLWMTPEIEEELMSYRLHRPSVSPDNAKYMSGIILDTVIQNMLRKAHNESDNMKMYLYSSHDSVVGPLLSLLGYDDEIQVPYTAAVIIELHKTGGEHSIKIFYRNDTAVTPYKITPYGCSDTSPCQLEIFHENFKDRIITDKDWETVCHSSTLYEDTLKDDLVPILSAVLVALVGLDVFLGIKAFTYWQRLKRSSSQEYSLLQTAADSSDSDSDVNIDQATPENIKPNDELSGNIGVNS